jgi:hypothetical protein
VEREQALVRLTEALTDGRIEATGYANAEALLRQATTYADLHAVVDNLDAKASLAERAQAVQRLDAAATEGLLEPAERLDRIAIAQAATTDEQLAALVSDLPAPTGQGATSDRRDGRRVSHAEREAVAERLRVALEEGLLDLTEFDERVRGAYAAKLNADLARLVTDLPNPQPVPVPQPAEPTPDRPRRGNTSRLPVQRRWWGLGGTALAVVCSSACVLAGYPVPGVLLLPAWGVVWAATAGPWVRSHRAEDVPGAAASSGPAPQAVKKPQQAGKPRRRARKPLWLEGHKGAVTALACLVLPDGTPVAITGSTDNTAMVWDLRDASLRHTLSGHTNDVVAVAGLVLPDGIPVAVTLSDDGTARVWDLRDGSPRGPSPGLRTKEPSSVACLTLPDGTPVAITGGYGPAKVWDLRDGSLLRQLGERINHVQAIAATVLPDGTPIATLVDLQENVKVRSLENGSLRSTLKGHTDYINALACGVLPDGTPVAVTASSDETARVWDLNRGKLRHTLTGHIEGLNAVACVALPDGTPIAVTTGYGEDARLWDLRDGSPCGEIRYSEGVMAGLTMPDRALVVMTTAVYTLT